MFGDILVDKFRYVFKKKDIPYEDRVAMKEGQRYYFEDSTIDYKCGNALNTFTPTKMTGERGGSLSHNLQMPEEALFYECLSDITLNKPEIQKLSRTTEIHLAKNFLLKNPVSKYICMLAQRSYSKLRIEQISSDKDGSYSLYLAYNHDTDSENQVKFVIKFYDKVQEYYKRHKTYMCQLFEPLNEYEKLLVGSAYCEETNTLNLEGLNILRIEIEYHGSEKIKPIKLDLDDERDFLSLDLLIDAMNEGKLYTTLDKIFTETLKKIVFNATETIETATAGLSKVRELACNLLLTSSSLHHYKAVADELELTSQFSTIDLIVRKVMPDSDLYQELYTNLFSNCSNEESSQAELVRRSCNSYSSKLLRTFILAYEVPIWDDS